jgi:hypothetical protein
MAAPENFPANRSNPDLPPDQFLYGRKGPWPQPSPAHPLKEAAEVLNIPSIENVIWEATIGKRLLESQIGFAGLAALDATTDLATPIPTDAQFNKFMLNTAYTRYMKPASPADIAGLNKTPGAVKWWKYDFSAMKLVKPLEGLYCAPVVCIFAEDAAKNRQCAAIIFRGETPGQNVTVCPSGPQAQWNLAKIYALQGAAYHMLFVVHPALHFPMDSVNAITKTAVPHTHLLFQLLYPHTGYTLALDNAVLEGAFSVVNENAQGTWFDPLMGNAYNLKLLFAAGYSGLDDPWYGDAYPPYDFMKPQMGFDSDYGAWLKAYFDKFLDFCTIIATAILAADSQDPYVIRWARYNSTYVLGFPDEKSILDRDCLARALAIFMWDVTVSHGADHYSFAQNISACYKFLRIRNFPPPGSTSGTGPNWVGDVSNGDDLHRAEMAHRMFFMPHAMKPNLFETLYPFVDVELQAAQLAFHGYLYNLSQDYQYSRDTPFQPLTEDQATKVSKDPTNTAYALTIPASIQY